MNCIYVINCLIVVLTELRLRKENSSLKIECFHTLKLDPNEPKTLGRVIIYFKNISTNSKVSKVILL